MAENGTNGSEGRWSRLRMAAWSAAALILLLPLIAMQFTDKVNWNLFDFLFAGAMLFGALGTYKLAVRMTANTTYRAAVGVALAAAVFLLWVSAAVGIIGSENHPANLMYGGVLAIAILGALIARFRPQGMARTLAATALAQALVIVIAGLRYSIWSPEAFALTGFFVALWLLSAWLFRKVAREQMPAGAAA